jgi:hypothetical protein
MTAHPSPQKIRRFEELFDLKRGRLYYLTHRGRAHDGQPTPHLLEVVIFAGTGENSLGRVETGERSLGRLHN